MTAHDDALDVLLGAIARHLGPRAVAAGTDNVDEILRLVIRHWPHKRLAELARKSRHHAGVSRSGALCRAQVREVWEARHGIDAWDGILASVAGVGWEYLLDQWWADGGQRAAYREHSKRLARQRRR